MSPSSTTQRPALLCSPREQHRQGEARAEWMEQQVRAGRSRRRLDTDGRNIRGPTRWVAWVGTEARRWGHHTFSLRWRESGKPPVIGLVIRTEVRGAVCLSVCRSEAVGARERWGTGGRRWRDGEGLRGGQMETRSEVSVSDLRQGRRQQTPPWTRPRVWGCVRLSRGTGSVRDVGLLPCGWC